MKRISAVLCAGIMLGTVGSLAACTPESNDNSSEIDPNIFAVYTAYAEEAGDNALSYADWYADLLAHAKGEKGDKGDEGDKGDIGANGKSAFEVWLAQDGNAGKTEEDFFAFLKGEKGEDGGKGDPGKDGDPGKAGSQWYSFETVPEASFGNDGDFCIVTSTSQIYKKAEGSWIIVLNLPMSGAEIKNDDTFKIPGSDVGWFKVCLMTRDIELSAEQLASIKVEAQNIDDQYFESSSLFEKSVESTPGNNIYYAVIPQLSAASNDLYFIPYKTNGQRQVKFSGIDGTLNAKVQIEKWTPPTLTALDAEFDWFYTPKPFQIAKDFYAAYNDYYGYTTDGAMASAWCTGSAVFFDPSLYETISKATLKFAYGEGAVQKFTDTLMKDTANKIGLICRVTGSSPKIYATANNTKLSEFLLSTGFTYPSIATSSKEKFFIEIAAKDSTVMTSVTTNVPVRVKLTKVVAE